MKNSFSIIASFIALTIIGATLVPLINLQLKPSRSLPTLNVSYSWYNASAKLIEQEVTSKLEGLFSAMKGVENISSVSSLGDGTITLEFKKEVDLDAARFELATLIRLAYPDLPEQVSYPSISNSDNSNETPPLLSYNLNAPASPNYIQKFANQNMVPKLSLVKGINNIHVYGAMPNQWEITYNVESIKSLGIEVNEISKAINRFLTTKIVGTAKLTAHENTEMIQVILENDIPTEINWAAIPIKKIENRIVLLGDIAFARCKEKQPYSYFRINGLNTISIVVYPEKNINTISLAADAKSKMNELKKSLPDGFSVILAYDASEDLSKELQKLGLRAIFSLVVLLLFVFLMSRQLKYLFLILISLISNLLIACIFYFVLKIEIHLYSLAGITISFGIIIDNSIIMIHHYLGKGNRKVFLSILAASLTTIGALIIIFFLKESQRINLIDFAWVIIINLAVSLLIALLFIPALLQKVSLVRKTKRKARRKKKVAKILLNFYGRFIIFNKRIKWFYFLVMILVFGIPFHLLPEKIEGDDFAANLYNKSFGSDWYQQDAKSLINKWLGGTFRLFSEYVYEQAYYADPQRTSLQIRGSMPEGCTVHQLNDVITKMENFISQYEEVEMYQTTVRRHDNAQISILFKPEFENGSFPYYLKELITSKAIGLGGLDWTVYGVGKGFNNAINEGYKNSHIFMEGYNYQKLYTYAESLVAMLKENPRVDKIDIESQISWFSESVHEYNLRFKFENIGLYEQQLYNFHTFLANKLFQYKIATVYSQNELMDVTLRSNKANQFDLWDLKNYPLESKNAAIKMPVLASLTKEKTGNSIHKLNQQYQLVVSYDFIGPQLLSEKVMKKQIEATNKTLPLGFKCTEPNYGWWDKSEKKQYFLLFIVIFIIYFICSILLESFIQPLAIIAMIPISFIGVFITFYFFEFNFDQGGFASFILLAGITVNAGIYLINEYNQLKVSNPARKDYTRYLLSFKNKIAPIFLTIISTILGLVPFVYAGQHEVFWFAFAIGSIGGLMFSFVAIVIYLPLMIKLSNKKI